MNLPVPLTVVTGFLGSGKTTLLKALLRHPDTAGTAVIVNEFGEVGIDDALIASAGDKPVLLPSGCVCCAVRGDLIEALVKLHKDMMWGEIPPLSRVVLETSGLADPAPIAHTLINEREVFRVYRLDGIIATVDAQQGLDQLSHHYEPAKQIAIADRIVLTKTDVANSPDRAALEARIAELNPAAETIPAAKGAIAPSRLFDLHAYETRGDASDRSRWLAADRYRHASHHHGHPPGNPHCAHPDHDHGHEHGHLHGIASFCLDFDQPLEARKIEFAIELLRRTQGEKLLRVKGLLNIAGQDRPFVIHGVQHVFYPPEMLEHWPGEDRRSRLVFITKDLDEAKVRRVFAPLLEAGVGFQK